MRARKTTACDTSGIPGSEDPGSRAPRIEGLLFDLDGTLIDSIPLIMSSLRHALHTVLGVLPPDEDLMRNIGRPLIDQLRGFSPEYADELLLAYREHNDENHDCEVKEYPGTAQALEALSRLGYPMGVVTSKTKAGATRGLEVCGLKAYFDVLVAYEDTKKHKPEPEPLERAADLLGLPIASCAYVGDSEFDMIAARACGAVGIAALWGPFPAERILGPAPQYALGTIKELPDLLLEERR